jgi:hypothetical protein
MTCLGNSVWALNLQGAVQNLSNVKHFLELLFTRRRVKNEHIEVSGRQPNQGILAPKNTKAAEGICGPCLYSPPG